MKDSSAFEAASSELETLTSLDRLEARGTLRLALKEVGLKGGNVGAFELKRVVERLLPKQLETRGVSDSKGVCGRLCAVLSVIEDVGVGGSALRTFARFGAC